MYSQASNYNYDTDHKAITRQTCTRLSTNNTTLAHGITQHVLKCSIRDCIDMWWQAAASSNLCVLPTFLSHTYT